VRLRHRGWVGGLGRGCRGSRARSAGGLVRDGGSARVASWRAAVEAARGCRGLVGLGLLSADVGVAGLLGSWAWAGLGRGSTRLAGRSAGAVGYVRSNFWSGEGEDSYK
jgi:hypothetical protein